MNAWSAPLVVSKISSEEPSVHDGGAKIAVTEGPAGMATPVTGTVTITVSVTVTVFTIWARMIVREAEA